MEDKTKHELNVRNFQCFALSRPRCRSSDSRRSIQWDTNVSLYSSIDHWNAALVSENPAVFYGTTTLPDQLKYQQHNLHSRATPLSLPCCRSRARLIHHHKKASQSPTKQIHLSSSKETFVFFPPATTQPGCSCTSPLYNWRVGFSPDPETITKIGGHLSNLTICIDITLWEIDIHCPVLQHEVIMELGAIVGIDLLPICRSVAALSGGADTSHQSKKTWLWLWELNAILAWHKYP